MGEEGKKGAFAPYFDKDLGALARICVAYPGVLSYTELRMNMKKMGVELSDPDRNDIKLPEWITRGADQPEIGDENGPGRDDGPGGEPAGFSGPTDDPDLAEYLADE